jgi:hypothetical protein
MEWARIGTGQMAQKGTTDDLTVSALQLEATKNPV